MPCRTCGRELPHSSGGRPRIYCSDACRSRAYRDRHSFTPEGRKLRELCEQVGRLAADLGDEVNLVRAFVSRRAVAAHGVVGAATLDEATRAVLDRAGELRRATEHLLGVEEPTRSSR